MAKPNYKVDDRPKKGAWAPGDFINTCVECNDYFLGDKRATSCADCAYFEIPQGAESMSKPKPRRDDKNVPWCTGYRVEDKPACWDDCDSQIGDPACLPQVQIDEARLIEAEAENARLQADVGMLEPLVEKLTAEIARFKDDYIDCLAERDAFQSQNTQLRKDAARLRAELDKWPRVYWYSSNPKSLIEGYRVLSISGKESCGCEDSWCEVFVDNPEYDGKEFAAASDFGLYSSSADAEAARADNG